MSEPTIGDLGNLHAASAQSAFEAGKGRPRLDGRPNLSALLAEALRRRLDGDVCPRCGEVLT